MYKIFLLVSLSFLLFACDDDNAVNPTKNTNTIAYLPLSTGNTWYYQSPEGEKSNISVQSASKQEWQMLFWEKDKRIELQTYVLKRKVLKGAFPVVSYFAIAETEKGYHFGTKEYEIIDPHERLSYYKQLFFIPHDLKDKDSVIASYTGTVASKEYNCVEHVHFKRTQDEMVNDTLRKAWNISYFAERTGYKDKKIGQEFIYVQGLGFQRFWNALFTSFEQ